MSDRKKSAAEKLREHNLAKLVTSAETKAKAGQQLSTAEINAVEQAQLQSNRRRDLPYLERMPKREFIATFGGSSKVYLDWHRERGFPWVPNEDYVDAIAAMRWMREAAAGQHETTPEKLHAARLKKAQADKAELELDRLRGKLVEVDEILVDVGRVGAKLREGIEELEPEDQKKMTAKLDEAQAELARYQRGSD